MYPRGPPPVTRPISQTFLSPSGFSPFLLGQAKPRKIRGGSLGARGGVSILYRYRDSLTLLPLRDPCEVPKPGVSSLLVEMVRSVDEKNAYPLGSILTCPRPSETLGQKEPKDGRSGSLNVLFGKDSRGPREVQVKGSRLPASDEALADPARPRTPAVTVGKSLGALTTSSVRDSSHYRPPVHALKGSFRSLTSFQ